MWPVQPPPGPGHQPSRHAQPQTQPQAQPQATGAADASTQRLRILDPHWPQGRPLRPRSVLRRPCGALAARRAVRAAAAAFDDVARQAPVSTRPLIIRRSRRTASAGCAAPG